MKMPRRWLACLLSLSLVLCLVLDFTHAQARATSYGRFVIYYGWYSDSSGKLGNDIYRIIESKPEFVISPFYNSAGQVNLVPQVIDLYHQNGIQVIVYVATGNAQRSLYSVQSEIRAALQAGADGVMLDEVSALNSQPDVDYYQSIYDQVKQDGKDKLVIANPGSVLISEKIMNMTDILSFEHQWRLASSLDWFSKYPASRYMGVSGNDIANAMGYNVDAAVAPRDTIEAWQSGIGFHYSTDSYTSLPPWFGNYENAVGSYSQSAANPYRLTVQTKSQDGTELRGLWIEVRNNGAIVSTGFSPAQFTLPQGKYQVWASSFEGLQFSKWSNGTDSAPQEIDMNGNQSQVAVYEVKKASLDITSMDTQGNGVKGISVKVLHGGATVATGYTPLRVSLPTGNYTVQAPSYQFFQFGSWSDGVGTWNRDIDLSHNTTLTASYANLLAGKLGTAVLPDGCYSVQNEQMLMQSLVDGGPLQAAMQYYSYQTSLLAPCGG